MPTIHATLRCPLHDSFRVRQVMGMFDLPYDGESREEFSVDMPGLDEAWTIGAIVGPSGSGKTSVARAAFGEAVVETREWPREKAVVDGFGERSIREITRTLTAVGFSSPPAWLKPYAVLSGGERFRAELARALLDERPVCVFDEFTSVVDRTVAQIGSAAVSKAIRQGNLARRFVAVTCHYDVLDWLEPDWVLDMASGELARRRLRRPGVQLEIVRTHHSAWRFFRRHHYLRNTMSTACECYLALWRGEPVAFCALMAQAGRKGCWRISRLVVLPDYQGIGIGTRLANVLAETYRGQGREISITTSHPAMIQTLRRSPSWRATDVRTTGFGVQTGARNGRIPYYVKSVSQGRPVVTFRFLGSEQSTSGKRGVA